MVVKKKRTYKKQKGGLLVLPKIPDKLTRYFEFVRIIINTYYNCTETRQDHINLAKKGLYDNINIWYESYKSNILIKNLAEKLIQIYKQPSSNNIRNIVTGYNLFISNILICILFDVFSNETENIFIKKLLKLFIQIIFVNYVYKGQLITIIDELFNRFNIDIRLLDEQYLMNLIKRLFLEEYKGVYGIPVFYGNENYNIIQYNQFICEKVGITSKEKRNYIINPVGALVHLYIKHLNKNNNPLYDLLGKILRFNYVEERNKIREIFVGLPKLQHLSGTSKFCIAVNQHGNEEIVESSTISKCSKVYGCSLEMTPVIRKENIASDDHILELLSIILKEDLDKPIPQNNSLTRRIIGNLNTHQEFLPEKQKNFSSVVRKNNNFSLYNYSLTPAQLLLPNKYNATLDKIYREASILTRPERKYNRADIRKIKRLLEIINFIRKTKRFNIDYSMYQNLEKRLDDIYNPNNNSPQF